MNKYTYKKIQEMRESLIQEIKLIFPTVTCDVLRLVEMRIQTALMAGLFDDDIKKETNKKKQ